MSSHFEWTCPHCRHKVWVRDEYVGQRVRCKYCDHDWVLDAEEAKAIPKPPAGAASETAIVGWSWPEAVPRIERSPPPARLGDFELLEEVTHGGMIAVHRARRVADGRAVTLRVEVTVVPDGLANDSGALVIPGYELIETLREGTMGRVYRARQTSLDRQVAIKVLQRAFLGRPEYHERFLREAKLVARLSHQNFIQTIDAGEACGLPYYVMEYVAGETLESRLVRERTIDEKTAIAIALGLAEALRHAHRRGVIHRDVKPANVILAVDGGLKLADLGLARSVEDEEWAAAEAGMAVGTPEYISPEQIRGQVDVDVRSDIYSLGATLYRAVTGSPPLAGGTSKQVMRRHLDPNAEIVPPERLNAAISSGLSAIILKSTARNREDRFRLPDDLIAALRALSTDGT